MRARASLFPALAAALVVTACSGPLPGEDLARAAELARQEGSVSVFMRMEAHTPSGNLTVEGDGAFDLTNSRGRLDLSTALPEGTPAPELGDTELVYDGLVMYMKWPGALGSAPQGKSWLKIDLEKAAGADLAQLGQMGDGNPMQGLDYLKGTKDIQEVGQEDVRGVSTTHYSATLDFELLHDQLPSQSAASVRRLIQTSGLREAPIDVWLDADGLPRRASYRFSPEDAGAPTPALTDMSFTMELFDYGNPVRVEIPPASEVFEQPGR